MIWPSLKPNVGPALLWFAVGAVVGVLIAYWRG